MIRPVAQLGYLGFGVSDLEAWASFATQILGLQLTDRDEHGFDLRLDSHRRRFLIRKDPLDDLNLVGWQAADADSFDALVERLEGAGAAPRTAPEPLRKVRGVNRLVQFEDPAGIPSELALGHDAAATPFTSELVRDGFVAEELGLGHLVVTSEDQTRSEQFYEQTLGFGFSDRISCTVYGYDVDIAFFHTNARHHSVAVGGRLDKRIHHFMIEAKAMDEVGRAYDRCIRQRIPIMNTLGRHPNDQMFSFYAFTPSGFQFEFGWGGRAVDPADHPAGAFDRISEWGHHPPALLAPRKKKP